MQMVNVIIDLRNFIFNTLKIGLWHLEICLWHLDIFGFAFLACCQPNSYLRILPGHELLLFLLKIFQKLFSQVLGDKFIVYGYLAWCLNIIDLFQCFAQYLILQELGLERILLVLLSLQTNEEPPFLEAVWVVILHVILSRFRWIMQYSAKSYHFILSLLIVTVVLVVSLKLEWIIGWLVDDTVWGDAEMTLYLSNSKVN